MGDNRRDDPDSNATHFRSEDRVMHINGSWWFAAREGDMGPYRSREEAEREAAGFLERQAMAEQLLASREAVRHSQDDPERKIGIWSDDFHA